MKNEFQVIADLIEKDKKVLDVGCADGALMKFLKDNKNINIRGLEISKKKVQECIAKGLTVIEGNAEKDLKQFPDKSFDYVVLSQTLQAFLNPELVLDELLRVGKKAIVTIPPSSISILVLVLSVIPFIVLPPGPITVPISSGSILKLNRRGAWGDRLSFGVSIASNIFPNIWVLAGRAWFMASPIVSIGSPVIFISIWFYR